MLIGHHHSSAVKARVRLAALLLLSTGLSQTLISQAPAPPNSRTISSQSAPASAPAQPLDPAFKGKLPITELTENEAILHALNRLGYGPRPGDVERVKRMGLDIWIERQLHPEEIDDASLKARLAEVPAANLNAKTLLAE